MKKSEASQGRSASEPFKLHVVPWIGIRLP